MSKMKLQQSMIQPLFSAFPKTEYEFGGILGGTDGVITQFYLDKGLEPESYCEYRPDVDALNTCIAQWSEQEIEFYGMFHTHFGASKTLSLSDQSYIQTIMQAMPEEITQLYFPVILLPEKQIVSYIATRKQEQITIACDEISLVTI